jgi:hypothetical protein
MQRRIGDWKSGSGIEIPIFVLCVGPVSHLKWCGLIADSRIADRVNRGLVGRFHFADERLHIHDVTKLNDVARRQYLSGAVRCLLGCVCWLP